MNSFLKKIKVLCILLLFLSSGGLFAQNLTNLQLLDAVKKNDITQAKALLKEGADLGFRDSNGTPLVMWAAYKARPEMVKFLIDAGAPYNQKGVIYIDGEKGNFYGHLLGIAAGENNLALVKYLVDDLHVDINEVEFQPNHSNSGWTALEWAFYKEYAGVFNYLIEKGALIRPETYPLIDHFFRTKNGLDIVAKLNQLNTLAKKQKIFSDSLGIYSLIVKGRALVKIKSVREGLDSIKLAVSQSETKGGSFNLLKSEALHYVASGYLNNYEYDSAIRYYHNYFNAAPIEKESSIEPAKKAVIYSEMWEAYRKAGRLNDWEVQNKIFLKKMDQASPKLASSFFYSFGRIMQDRSLDESSAAYKKVFEIVHPDNEVYAVAAAYYGMRTKQNLTERLEVLEKLNHFKDQYPKYAADIEFMSYAYVLEALAGVEYAVNGDLKNAMSYFDRAQEGAIKPFLDPKFEFFSYDTKSLFTPMKTAQVYVRLLASIEPDQASTRMVSMIANELIKGIVESDRSAKFSELPKYGTKSYVSGLYNELLSGLGKKDAIVFMTARNNYRMASKFPGCVVYILMAGEKVPKAIAISDYNSLEQIIGSSDNSATKMQQLYLAFWQRIQKEIPKKIKKIYFIPDGVMENQSLGNFVDPASSKKVSDTYQIENKKLLSDLLKD